MAGAQLGHSAKVALRHYDDVREEDLQEAVQRASLGVLPSVPPPESGQVIRLSERLSEKRRRR